MYRIKRIFLQNFKKILQHQKSDTKHIFTSPPLLAYRRDTNLKQLLIRSSLNLKPNGTHACGHALCRTVNTPILPMPYLVPKTLSIFNTTLLAHLSVLSTPLLVLNAPLHILVKLAVSSTPDLENT